MPSRGNGHGAAAARTAPGACRRALSQASGSASPTREFTALPAMPTPANPERCSSAPRRASPGIENLLPPAPTLRMNALRQETAVSPVTDIIAELKTCRMVVLVDEEDRENEGDLLMAAEFATAETINFMARYGRGLICLTLTEERCRVLNLPLMVSNNRSPLGTNFTVSIEAAQGVTTGISAADRARTVRAAIRADAGPRDVVQPGHIFPLMAQEGGVLVRAGHTEAGCDLARLAGLAPAAVICEILGENGEMARLPDLIDFAAEHALKIGTITDLIQHRSQTESLVTRVAERDIETVHGMFRLHVYSDRIGRETHLALTKGAPAPGVEALVRVHEPLSAIDLLDVGSRSHSWNFHDALAAVGRADCGDRKSTRLNSSHGYISYAVFCLKKKTFCRQSAW